ncbi:NADH:flavin oxidoreductase/NADH oxidase [Deinococcus roseus]|uniref:Oxidoreductase n=1 Tax=Deinococcus roseus TaxID=392414 RepID=A0ABQ2CY22_9DEIO|nr:NADH:flavin oxidoreductase/NADH oxidase [Deinococcus roseus]GGJ25221.1 oxidoreductase [Deinococcus roseus]
MSQLFTPITFRGVTLKNRIVVSPMCQYSSENGYPGDWHLVHLGAFAQGGAALVITEATAVVPEGRISPDDLGIWEDGQAEALSKIVQFIKGQGAVAGIQLAHAGRKASVRSPWDSNRAILTPEEGGWEVVAPSAVPFTEGWLVPHALTLEEIQKLRENWVAAALRSVKAGFEVLEIHAAHGYLFHEFLSPLSNHRTDEYGGSLENRSRLLLEVTRDIREAIPAHLSLWVRISATDWTEGGWTPEESVELSKALKAAGVDLIDTSTGGNVATAKIPVEPGYQVRFAEQIKHEAGIPTGAVGLITEPQQAEQIVVTGQADVVLLARAVLREPHWAQLAAKALGVKPEAPRQYARAWL